MQSPIVLLLQQPRLRDNKALDFSEATKYGTLHTLFSDSDRPSYDPSANYAAALERMRVIGFTAERDFLLWAGGDPLALLLGVQAACVCAGAARRVRMLRWERLRNDSGQRLPDPNTGGFRGYYVPITLPF